MKKLSTARLLEISTSLTLGGLPPFTRTRFSRVSITDIYKLPKPLILNSDPISLISALDPEKPYFVILNDRVDIISCKGGTWAALGDNKPYPLFTDSGLTENTKQLFGEAKSVTLYPIEEKALIDAAHCFIYHSYTGITTKEIVSEYPPGLEGILDHIQAILPEQSAGAGQSAHAEEKRPESKMASSAHTLFSGEEAHPSPVLQQNCAENMLLAIAERQSHSLARELDKKFQDTYTDQSVRDTQIELEMFFALQGVDNQVRGAWGQSAELLARELARSLDPDTLYFMRTGQNGRAGHFQALYYSDGWHAFSTTSNQKRITDSHGNLTEGGHDLLRPHGAWDERKSGAYCFTFTPCKPEMLEPLADYIIAQRLPGKSSKP